MYCWAGERFAELAGTETEAEEEGSGEEEENNADGRTSKEKGEKVTGEEVMRCGM